MTAPTKSWTAILDASIAAGKPVDTTLMTALRDNLAHLEEWLGKDFTAAQNHNHDGVNSAALEIGPNWIRNGTFENALTGWTSTLYTGGTITTGSSHETEGVAGLVITSTNAANGGGNVLSNEFIPIVGGMTRQFMMSIKGSAATVPLKAEVIWYDDTQSQISASTIISTTTATPTSARLVVRRIAAPATARYCKVKLELPAAGGAVGSVYFDGVVVTVPAMLGGEQVFTASGTFSAVWGEVDVDVVGGGGYNYGAGGGTAKGIKTTSGDVTVTIGAGGTSGAQTGGTSSFGSLMSATGGAPVGGAPGNGSGGANNSSGGRAVMSISAGDSSHGFGGGSDGTSSFDATGYGGGGHSNKNGSAGIVIVRW